MAGAGHHGHPVPALVLAHYLKVSRSVQFGGWLLTLAVAVLLALEIIWLVRSTTSPATSAMAGCRSGPLRWAWASHLNCASSSTRTPPLRTQGLHATVACVEHYRERRGSKTYQGVRDFASKKVTLAEAADVPAGQMLSGEGQVTFHGAAPATSNPRPKKYPWHTWEVRVELPLSGMVDYRATFPLQVT